MRMEKRYVMEVGDPASSSREELVITPDLANKLIEVTVDEVGYYLTVHQAEDLINAIRASIIDLEGEEDGRSEET